MALIVEKGRPAVIASREGALPTIPEMGVTSTKFGARNNLTTLKLVATTLKQLHAS